MQKLEAVDYTADNAAQLFVESLRDTGFGVLKNHPIPESRVSQIYEHWYDFFRSDQKQDYLFQAPSYDGFFPAEMAEAAKGHKTRDLKEYYHFYPWGKCPAELQNEIGQYYNDTLEFAGELLSWVEQHTPADVKTLFSEPLSTMISEGQQSLLRILHYPPIPADHESDAVRAQAHEDINLLTILPAANEPGLQVLARDKTWMDVPCDFGNLIINTGDMLQEASNGYYPSTTHRVINPDGANMQRSRISLPLFLHPRPDVKLSSRYTAESYRDERLRELQETD